MSITTLIERLQSVLDTHGDLPVGVDDYNSGYGGKFTPFVDVEGEEGDEFLEISASGQKLKDKDGDSR